MLVRLATHIKDAEDISDTCCFKKELIKDLEVWRDYLLKPMARRFDNKELQLPVRIRNLPEKTAARARFELDAVLFGTEIYNFRNLELNANSFFQNESDARGTLFHELSHTHNTLDRSLDSAGSLLWNAHFIEPWINNPSGFGMVNYFNFLLQQFGRDGCSREDLNWGQEIRNFRK